MTEKNSKVDQLLDELLKDAKGTQEILSREGLLGQLTKRLAERNLKQVLKGPDHGCFSTTVGTARLWPGVLCQCTRRGAVPFPSVRNGPHSRRLTS